MYVPPVTMPDGTRTKGDRKVVTAGSKNEALRWGQERRAVLIDEHRRRQAGELEAAKPKPPTFAEFAKEWLERLGVQAAKGEKRQSSVEAIESTLRLHVFPFIGDKRLDQIDDALEAKWVRGGYEYPGPWGKPIAVKPLASLATRNNRMSPVNAILKFAVERKRIRFMPCTIKIPSVEIDEAAFYEHGTYEALLGAAGTLDHRILVTLLLGGDAGLRRGEIIALDRSDIDFRSGEIVVRRSVYVRKGVRYESLPKGKKLKRIPTTERLLHALRKACTHKVVSPGAATATNVSRNAGLAVKYLFVPIANIIPGMNQTPETAARRYLQASEFGTDVSGQFFASAQGKFSGPIEAQRHPHLHDRASQEAAWQAVVNVSGVDFSSAPALSAVS